MWFLTLNNQCLIATFHQKVLRIKTIKKVPRIRII